MNTGECIKTIRITEVDVSHMDLSSAILTEDLAKMLWQNGAKISEADFEKYVRKHQIERGGYDCSSLRVKIKLSSSRPFTGRFFF